MDNLKVHTSNITKEHLDKLGIKAIFNVAYSPDFNPIETTFHQIKNRFKRLRTEAVVNNKTPDIEGLIRLSIDCVSKEAI
jgi:transposase